MSSGQIRNVLKDEHGFENPNVVAWERRMKFYVVGMKAEDVPKVNGFSPVNDPSLEE